MSTAIPRPLRLAVLINASAGTVRRQGAAAVHQQLFALFAQHGSDATVDVVPYHRLSAAATLALERAKAGTVDGIVIGGGDGSVRTFAHRLAGTGVPLGVLPLGTLNHFAKDAGIPVELEPAVAAITAGHQRAVDVGRANGEVFVNNSSIGLYPYLVLDRERQRRDKRLSKWTAMVLAGFRILRHLPVFRLGVQVERWAESYRSPILFVGNNEYQFSLAALGRRQRLDEGELCVYVVQARRPSALLGLIVRGLLTGIDHERDLRIIKGRAAEITSRRRRLLVALDGEVEVLRAPVRYQSWPAALKVFVPPPP